MIGLCFKTGNIAIRHQSVQRTVARLVKRGCLGETVWLPVCSDVSLGRPMDVANEVEAVAFKPVWMDMTRTVVAGQNQFFAASGQPLKAARKIITDCFVLSHK